MPKRWFNNLRNTWGKNNSCEFQIKQRDGIPAVVKGTSDLVRVKFDSLDNNLEKITWAKFFKTFRDNNLAFIYED